MDKKELAILELLQECACPDTSACITLSYLIKETAFFIDEIESILTALCEKGLILLAFMPQRHQYREHQCLIHFRLCHSNYFDKTIGRTNRGKN